MTRRATVKRIDRTSDTNTYRLTFVYETTNNPRTVETLTVSRKQLKASPLRADQPFTLLVNPDNEKDVLPYCLVDSYMVVGTYRPAAPLPVPVASVPATLSPTLAAGPVAAEWGVEPELFCAAPRPVLWKRNVRNLRVWIINLTVGAAAIGYYCVQNPVDFSEPRYLLTATGLGVFYFLMYIAWLVTEGEAAKSRLFLQEGYAVRATVDKCELSTYREPSYLEIRYLYSRADGKPGHGYLQIMEDEANRVGGIVEGTSFTVLRHPGESFTTIPYFRIKGVEVPGAGQVRTTPPGNAVP